MRLSIIIAACLLAAFGFYIWCMEAREYNYTATETAFERIAQNGFDEQTARQLIEQYEISDASFTKHFLAFGYIARLRNEAAFEVSGGEKWAALVKRIKEYGEAASEDWFGPEKHQEIRKSAAAMHADK